MNKELTEKGVVIEYFEYGQDKNNQEFILAQSTVREIYDFMSTEQIKNQINETHQVNATSHKIQEIFIDKCIDLGFSSEKKGLFSDYKTPQLRPDYHKPINETGIIMEVERGKTITNNMDLLDIWKCHICKEADYLLLIVPIVRQTNSGRTTKTFDHVVNRINSFFREENFINVKGCFIIGY